MLATAIADPRAYIVKQLSDDLQQRYGLILERRPVQITGYDARQIKAAHPTSDLIFDAQIDEWSLETTPNSPRGASKYRLLYVAHVRLIDAKEGVDIAEGTCHQKSVDKTGTLTYDDLMANHAERLKTQTYAMTRSCVDAFRSGMLPSVQVR